MPAKITQRAAAIFLHEGHVLIHHTREDGLWALPGGRIEPGEIGAGTLHREMREELGTEVAVGPLQWVVENHFTYEGRQHHEIGLYYLASFRDTAFYDTTRTYAGLEEYTDTPGVTLNMTFHWVPIAEVDRVPTLRPKFLYRELREVPGPLAHFVIRES